MKLCGKRMDKTDEGFWQFYKEALAKGWSDDNARRYDSRLVWRNAVAWKQAQDLAAVQTAMGNPPEYEGVEDHGWEDACIEILRRIKGAE